MKRYLIGAVVGAMTMAAAAQASASVNLLVNGSFETGDFSGWTQGGNLSYTFVEPTTFGYGAQQGSYYVYEGPTGSDGALSQTFTDTPGELLTIAGWLIGNGTSPSDFNMSFDGVTYVSVNPVPSQPWTKYSFMAKATGSDTFTVGFRNDPSFDGIDNFSVTASVIPEASTWAMLVAGFAGLAFVGRRARRSAATIS